MSEPNEIQRINETEEIELTRDGQNIYIANKGTVNIYGPSGEDSELLKSNEGTGGGCLGCVGTLAGGAVSIVLCIVLIAVVVQFWPIFVGLGVVLVIIAMFTGK